MKECGAFDESVGLIVEMPAEHKVEGCGPDGLAVVVVVAGGGGGDVVGPFLDGMRE